MNTQSRFHRGAADDHDMMEDTREFSIDLRGMCLWLWSRKVVIGGCMAVAGCLGFVIAAGIDPTFRADTKVIFDTREEALASGAGGQQVGDGESLQNEIEILQSRPLVERVVTDLHLVLNAEFNSDILPEQASFLGRVFQSGSGAAQASVDDSRILGTKADAGPIEVFGAPGVGAEWGQCIFGAPTGFDVVDEDVALQIRNVSDLVLENLHLQPVPGSRVLEIGYETSVADMAARIANAFATAYIAETVDIRLDAMRGATDWLDNRVAALRDQVREAEDEVEEKRADQAIRAAITAQQLEAQNATLLTVRNDMHRASLRYQRLRDAGAEGADLGALPEYSESELLETLRAREAEIRIQRADLLETLDEDHLLVARADEALDDIRNARQEEAWRITEAARLAWLVLKDEEEALRASIASLQRDAQAQSGELVEIRQIEREVEARQQVYENFLGRLSETAEQSKFESANARVLSAAVPPLFPTTQAGKRAVMICILLGFAVGVVFSYLRDRLSNTFSKREEIEELTGERVLATLPTFGPKLKRQPFLSMLTDDDATPISETARMLRTNVMFRGGPHPPKIIMVTSTLPGEGKSTIASLMALSLAQIGRQTALLDGDLRKPSIKTLFELDNDTPGALALLEGDASPEDVISRHELSGLDTLTIKATSDDMRNPADILSTQDFSSVVQILKKSYDHIVIDAPPTQSVADSWILAKFADAIIYVVRTGETPREKVIEGLDRLRAIGAPTSGIILNYADATADEMVGSYHYGFTPLLPKTS